MAVEEFIEFYKGALGLDQEDFRRFTDSIESGLLSAFRITPTPLSTIIREKLAKYSFISKVPFLEDVYTFNLKDKDKTYGEFIQFLVAQTNVGNIQRQEIVSMLPHKFLGAKSHHMVLETCASPGSKTKNLLETIKDGVLISNDKSVPRVNVLVSESMKKASTSFIVTQMDAAQFPTLDFEFDRICCDVPCSSDGTFRKNPAILPKWSVGDSIGLSSIQLRILRRALELLKDGGILVYSTCSLNPIEDEWVIDNALEDRRCEIVQDFDFVQYQNLDPSKVMVRKGIVRFKYGKFEFDNKDLEKCMRIMPHDQNTGGFFIAVLKKTSMSSHRSTPSCHAINSAFVEASEEVIQRVSKHYDVSKRADHFLSFNDGFKNLYAVSPACYRILCSNPKLKVAYAGMKAFTESDLKRGAFRAKSPYLEHADIAPDLTMPLYDFQMLLKNKAVLADQLHFKPEGLFSVQIESLPHKFCGFSGGGKVFLYIDENHRKAFSQIYLE